MKHTVEIKGKLSDYTETKIFPNYNSAWNYAKGWSASGNYRIWLDHFIIFDDDEM